MDVKYGPCLPIRREVRHSRTSAWEAGLDLVQRTQNNDCTKQACHTCRTLGTFTCNSQTVKQHKSALAGHVNQYNMLSKTVFQDPWQAVDASMARGRTGLQTWRSGLVVLYKTWSLLPMTYLSLRPRQMLPLSMCPPSDSTSQWMNASHSYVTPYN